MGYYIIIRGSQGVGKSTISKMLEKRLRGQRISTDEVGYNELGRLIESKMDKDRVVILDGVFSNKSYLTSLKKLPYKRYSFFLKINSVEELIERNPDRNRAMAKALVLIPSFEDDIVIETSGRNPEEILSDIMNHLQS